MEAEGWSTKQFIGGKINRPEGTHLIKEVCGDRPVEFIALVVVSFAYHGRPISFMNEKCFLRTLQTM